jgi:ABC-type sugar transport system ATPase subunit
MGSSNVSATPVAGLAADAASAVDRATLEVCEITKSFFTTRVLNDVSFSIGGGRTLGLVGENGAGKSTLMNILGGNLAPDHGSLRLGGEPYAPASPLAARRAGVAFVHQELNLFGGLSIAENLFLVDFPTRGGLILQRPLHRAARALLDRVGLDVPTDWTIDRLSAGEQQLVEIARALASDPRLLIMDEPTTSLTARETERLFGVIAGLQKRGITIVYISHALNDVLRLCDQIVVLRDGRLVAEGSRDRFTTEQLISQMVGRSIEQLFPQRTHQISDTARLEVRSLYQPGVTREISFDLRAGEVLGIAGLMGSGRTELARILYGLDPAAGGTIRLDGASMEGLSPRERMQRGMAFLTESRRDDGLCLDASIADNFLLAAYPGFAARGSGWLRRRPMAEAVRQLRSNVGLSPTAADRQPVQTLSGGNQQKVVLGRWLLTEPKLLILDEPTRGIDVGAKREIYGLINHLAERGAAILMISSELEELIGMCDRILVMNQGAIRDELPRAQFDQQRILRAAVHQRATEAQEVNS